jgi:hypothetical protein
LTGRHKIPAEHGKKVILRIAEGEESILTPLAFPASVCVFAVEAGAGASKFSYCGNTAPARSALENVSIWRLREPAWEKKPVEGSTATHPGVYITRSNDKSLDEEQRKYKVCGRCARRRKKV